MDLKLLILDIAPTNPLRWIIIDVDNKRMVDCPLGKDSLNFKMLLALRYELKDEKTLVVYGADNEPVGYEVLSTDSVYYPNLITLKMVRQDAEYVCSLLQSDIDKRKEDGVNLPVSISRIKAMIERNLSDVKSYKESNLQSFTNDEVRSLIEALRYEVANGKKDTKNTYDLINKLKGLTNDRTDEKQFTYPN